MVKILKNARNPMKISKILECQSTTILFVADAMWQQAFFE